jgi:hypothetical protein
MESSLRRQQSLRHLVDLLFQAAGRFCIGSVPLGVTDLVARQDEVAGLN